MKAAVFLGEANMIVQEQPISFFQSGEVLVQVATCGICGTDQHIYHGKPGSAVVTPPIVLGHELSGTVVQIGSEVERVKLGDRVTIDPNIYCGKCRYCRDGRPQLCEHLQAIGVTRSGGMGQFCAVPEANCYRLPDELSFEEGAMIEPLGCCLHGVSMLDIRRGYSAVVIGGGYIGLMMIQLLKQRGVSLIVVSEPEEDKHELALQLGASIVHNPTQSPLEDAVVEYIDAGADIVIECVGRTQTMQTAVQCAAKGGQILLFGVADPGTRVQISPFERFSKEVTIRGSLINPNTHEQAMSLVKDGHVQITPLLSHRFALHDVPNAMAQYATLKVMKGIIVHEHGA